MAEKRNDRVNSELYKELEIINIKELSENLERDKRGEKSILEKILRRKSKVSSIGEAWRKPQTQVALFQQSMKILSLCGQFAGLNPVINISKMDVAKMRFKYLSVRFIYSVFIFACQALATSLCIYRLFNNPISITLLAYMTFFSSVTITTFIFLRIAMKWPNLMKELASSCLDKYIDLSVQAKCKSYTVGLLSVALVEHVLSQCSKLHGICGDETNCSQYEKYLEICFPWFMELGVPFNIPLGIFLQYLNFISTINWSFSDVFIVCMSLYLVSILHQINKIIHDADKKYYQPSFWSRVREDYTSATRLVSSFDNVISGVILVSFASNLFFICLQLFYVLSHGLRKSTSGAAEERFGMFANNTTVIYPRPITLNGIEVYFMMSFMFVLGRFLAVSFVTASIHTASVAPAPALYSVSSSAYCTEVQRFQEQIHGSTVALTGLQFFYVTKGLVLSVAGSIVTYELVMLQFSNEA